MRSFLPNHPLINAARCCANPDCAKKEAEAEAETETETEPLLLLDIICPGCRSVHYCTVKCQETHSKNHKLQCKQDAEDIREHYNDDDNDNDNESFQAIPPKDDCIICTLPLPIDFRESIYLECCGKVICDGCYEENIWVAREQGPQRKLIPPCPFCRKSGPLTDDEIVVRIKKRMEVNDSEAIFVASHCYKDGKYGLPKDPQTAFDLYLRAADLGHSGACHNLATFYGDGVVVTKDMTKARTYYEMAAEKGDIEARHNLGVNEWKKGNYRLACRHLLISAAAGYAKSLEAIAEYYQYQLVTKEEYSTALTSYSNVHKNEYSIEREVAAAAYAAAVETKRQNSSSN